ncbi:hypothetical protein ACOBQX_03240 [Actinokineospora sp. G85]|uniref:hypothetical protein n=1 Tax=Actinokineospora sp. G85 TaxID=3406626 RepID=UPI003C7398AE
MKPWEVQEVVGVIGVFTLITVVIAMVVWQVGAGLRAKAALAREAAYQELAGRAVAAQEGAQRELVEIGARVGELRGRVDSVERLLKEIE